MNSKKKIPSYLLLLYLDFFVILFLVKDTGIFKAVFIASPLCYCAHQEPCRPGTFKIPPTSGSSKYRQVGAHCCP